MSFLRKGTWLVAPHGVPMFDGKKSTPHPRPVIVLEDYAGYTRVLGRSTKPNDDPATKLNHPPHRYLCDQGVSCWISERGYISLRKTDVWTPFSKDVDKSRTCFEPDEDWLDEFDRRTRKL